MRLALYTARGGPDRGREATRPNPGFAFIRGGSSIYPTDELLPVPYGKLRRALLGNSRRSKGNEPIPFLWLGMTYLFIAEPEFYRLDDMLTLAVEQVPEIPAELVHQSQPGEIIEGFMVVNAETGIVRELVFRDAHRVQWDRDLHAPVLLTLLKALRWEGVILPTTKMEWSFVTLDEPRYGLPRKERRDLDLGTVGRLIG